MDEEKITRLQENLSLIRTCAGWSAAALGEQLDVSRQMVSSLENGRNRMTRMQYLAIRKVIEDEIRQAPEETVLLRDVVRVLVDEPEAFSAEDRARVLADASLISPAIVSKKTTRQNASIKWATVLAGVAVAAVGIGMALLGGKDME